MANPLLLCTLTDVSLDLFKKSQVLVIHISIEFVRRCPQNDCLCSQYVCPQHIFGCCWWSHHSTSSVILFSKPVTQYMRFSWAVFGFALSSPRLFPLPLYLQDRQFVIAASSLTVPILPTWQQGCDFMVSNQSHSSWMASNHQCNSWMASNDFSVKNASVYFKAVCQFSWVLKIVSFKLFK